MTVYVVVVEDRHVDLGLTVFSTAAAAVAHAQYLRKRWLERYEHDPSDFDEDALSEEDLKRAGLLFHGAFSVEGDDVWVKAVEVDAAQSSTTST